jgi:UDP-N-acetylmuramate dehydrogenase
MFIDSESKQKLISFFGSNVKFDEPMSKYTSFQVGGPAKIFAAPDSINDLQHLIKLAIEKKWPYMIIGAGTNLLVKDKGIQAVVIHLKNCLTKITITKTVNNDVFVTAMAGAYLSSLCNFAINNGLERMNFALGIPGTVGGAILMNAGTTHGSIADVLTTLTVLDKDGNKKDLNRENIHLDYRSLTWDNHIIDACNNSPVILDGCFKLHCGDRNTLKKQAEAILLARKKQQPTHLPSAGCFFKNPQSGKTAGELIEMAGLKGTVKGSAQISSKHANFIVNQGNASASDILELVLLVQERVSKMFNQVLIPEVIIVGE